MPTQNPNKINLGVGVYYDDNGKVPLLECVRKAEAKLMEQAAPRTYLPIDGLAAYDKAVQELVFGADSAVIQEKRAITVQAIGGTGALKIGADFLKRFSPDAQVWISDPSWENHRALFECGRLHRQQLRLLRRGHPRREFRRHAGRAEQPCRPARSSCCTPAATTRPAPTSTQAQWDQVIDAVQAARPGSVPRHGLPGLRRRHRRRRRCGAPLRRGRRPAAGRRTRSRSRSRCTASASARCRSSPPSAGRSAARAVAAQARRAHQLLEPASPWRPGGRARC